VTRASQARSGRSARNASTDAPGPWWQWSSGAAVMLRSPQRMTARPADSAVLMRWVRICAGAATASAARDGHAPYRSDSAQLRASLHGCGPRYLTMSWACRRVSAPKALQRLIALLLSWQQRRRSRTLQGVWQSVLTRQEHESSVSDACVVGGMAAHAST